MLNNPYQTHDITHLSASTINRFILNPAHCLVQMMGVKGAAGPAAWRGSAVDKIAFEAAQESRRSESELLHAAMVDYDLKAQFEMTTSPPSEEKIESERADIPKYVANAYEFYGALPGSPISEQGKITIQVGDLPIPFIGYYDLLYDDAVRDCKTVGRMVSSLSYAHARQGAIYAVGTGKPAFIDYIGKRGTMSFEVLNHGIYIDQVYRAAKALELALGRSSDLAVCAEAFFPDLDHWIWDAESIAMAKSIWNMNDETITARIIK